jgi:GGDEF domain-containing protein
MARLGVEVFDYDMLSMDDLLAHADMALTAAKALGEWTSLGPLGGGLEMQASARGEAGARPPRVWVSWRLV